MKDFAEKCLNEWLDMRADMRASNSHPDEINYCTKRIKCWRSRLARLARKEGNNV